MESCICSFKYVNDKEVLYTNVLCQSNITHGHTFSTDREFLTSPEFVCGLSLGLTAPSPFSMVCKVGGLKPEPWLLAGSYQAIIYYVVAVIQHYSALQTVICK